MEKEKRKSTETNENEVTERKRSRPTSGESEPGVEIQDQVQDKENTTKTTPKKSGGKSSLPAVDQVPSCSAKKSDETLETLSLRESTSSFETIPLKTSAACINLTKSSTDLISEAPSLEDLSPDVIVRHTRLVSREGARNRKNDGDNTETCSSSEGLIANQSEAVPGLTSRAQAERAQEAVVESSGDQPAVDEKAQETAAATAEAPPEEEVRPSEPPEAADPPERPPEPVPASQNQKNNKMGELSEAQLQMLVSDLQLQLNAAQQDKASLELEIRQKEEVVLKTQVQAQKNEAALKQEIKQLKEKLKEKSKISEEDSLKDLEKGLREAKEREAKAMTELNARHAEDEKFSKTLVEYEDNYQKLLNEFEKLKDEHMLTAGHLASLESAFSDLLRKYERSKASVNQLKSREDSVNFNLDMSAENIKKAEARYESLKTYAQAQIEKCNKEILSTRDRYESDNSKLKAIVKRLEIKCNSLDTSLQQKNKECLALSELCDHITSNQVEY